MLLARIPKTQSQASLDARTTAEYLRHMTPDEFVSYGDLSALVGRNVQQCRHILRKARDIVRREDHLEFAVVTNKGLKRLAGAAFIGLGEDKRKRVSRMSRKTLQQLHCANHAELPEGEVPKLLGYVSVFGAMAALSHFTTMRKVQQTIAQNQLGYRLPVDQVVDALRKTR